MVRLCSAILVVLVLLGQVVAQQTLRVATWNVESLNNPGGFSWNAAVANLLRMQCEVIGIQEIDSSDVSNVALFAAQSGYAHHAFGSTSGSLSGGLRNGVLSVHPILFSQSHDAVSISGDASANDMTRDIFEAHVQVPGLTDVLGVFVLHLKASSGDTNEFRRAVELQRVHTLLAAFRAAHPAAAWMVMGDMNDDIDDGPFNQTFFSLPSGLPQTYSLGSDITFPLTYDPFASFTGVGAQIMDATQEDSTTLYVTRAMSGRRLDYVFFGGPVTPTGDEVYNSVRDNGFDDPPVGNWLPKNGPGVPNTTSINASDHFPVFGEFQVGFVPPPAPDIVPGDVVVSEWLADPQAVSDSNGEWLELFNTTAQPIDLGGFTLRDQGSESITLPSLVVPARGYVVLARNGNSFQNGGVLADFTYSSFFLSNSFDEIEVVSPQGVIVDSVVYDNGATYPDPSGASVERIDATVITRSANFGVATTSFGFGDLGTPGAPNSIGVVPNFTTLTTAGSHAPGTTSQLFVDAGPALGNRGYLIAASLGQVPFVFPVSGKSIDLVPDFAWIVSLTPQNGFFVNFQNILSPLGQASASVHLPPVPLPGVSLHFSGLVLDGAYPDAIASVMDNATMLIP